MATSRAMLGMLEWSSHWILEVDGDAYLKCGIGVMIYLSWVKARHLGIVDPKAVCYWNIT